MKLIKIASAVVVLLASTRMAGAQGFVLKDHLNRTWKNEAVTFTAAGGDLERARAGKALQGPDGKPVLYELQGDRVTFIADLGPMETRSYRFTDAASDVASDLKVEETPDAIRLVNARTGIALRKKLDGKAGPISGLRLASGAWVGNSTFETRQALTAYSAQVTASGPVFAEVTCRAEFGPGRNWTGVFRLQAGEPVVLVDEKFNLADKSRLALSLAAGFEPSRLIARPTAVKSEVIGEAADAPTVFKLQPWTSWGPARQGKWFAVYGDKSDDLLMMGARRAEDWVDLRKPRDTSVFVEQTATDVRALLHMDEGRRFWMIGSMPKAETVGADGKSVSPLPQQEVIQREFSLDTVKDYVLEWPNADKLEHPRLFMKPRDVARLATTFKPTPAEVAKLATAPITIWDTEPWIMTYLATGDAALGRNLADTAVKWMQDAVDMQVNQESMAWLGRAPHGQTIILSAVNLADAVLGSNAATPEQKRRIRSQAAFLGYTVMRPDYWSPLRGFAANPNMTSHVACYQATIGCLLLGHPEARKWVAAGLHELKDIELSTWMDSNGGWVEAPGYAMVSWNYILGSLLAARNSGYEDYVHHPNVKKLLGWFAKMSTPPDSRLKGKVLPATRHIPPIGHTWKLAWCGEFGLAAALWKDKDPEFAANMAWMHQQHDSYNSKVGGFVVAMSGYRNWLTDLSGITPKPPAYGSELFPESGVIMRSHFPSDRETMLYMIAGQNAHHYDHDSGSVTLWGKGRIISDEFGYYGWAPVADHSMVEVPLMQNEIMSVHDFYTGPHMDYTMARLDRRVPSDENHLTSYSHLDYQHSVYSDWIRQIAFIKDADPTGPNYFVLNDTLRSPIPATWRMWFTCQGITTGGQGATVIGKEDVDTDVFFARPAAVPLKTEEKTRATSGYNEEGKYGRWDWTQTGLIADVQAGTAFTTVVYPRLKTQKPAKFTALADGRVVKVESAAGTDYVFLSADPFEFKQGDISFSGTSGSVQQRGKRVMLSLGAPGRIAGFGQTLESDKPAHKTK